MKKFLILVAGVVLSVPGFAFAATDQEVLQAEDVGDTYVQYEESQLRETLLQFRCEFIDCEEEAKNFFGDSVGISPLFVLADFQEKQTAKRDELAKQQSQLIEYRQYKKSQAELAANEGAPESPCETGKCILVVLARQMSYAYEDGVLVFSSAISSGKSATPTPRGTFHVYGKTRSQKMSGPGYYLPNVPYILWFKGDYSFHGTYWHSNFGHPMSHGCVNLPTPNAKWYFDWAPVGTPVYIR